MNIRDIKTYFAHLLLMGVLCTLTSCQRRLLPAPTPEYHPIELSVSSEWPVLTKAPITGVEDLVGDGFVVWASWAKNSDDEAIYTGDYASGSTNAVFGVNGTKVYATDGNQDEQFTPDKETLDKWYYTPERFWQRGSYTFAAALPASAFNASCIKADDDASGTENIIASLDSDNTLTLSFGQDKDKNPIGFDLSANQIDLMVTFCDVDNSMANAKVAKLKFLKHSFAQIGIEAACVDENASIIVDDVVFCGNHKATTGPITFTNTEAGVSATYEIDTSTATNVNNPYKVISSINEELPKAVRLVDGSWSHTYKSLVSGLLVFPEESMMTIVVRYRIFLGNNTVTSQQMEGTVTTSEPITWAEGKKHLYKLQISANRVNIISSSVMEWDDEDITHTFS